jgi:hypothetical protein
LPDIVSELHSRSQLIRFMAAWTLAHIGPAARPALPELRAAQSDPSSLVRDRHVLADYRDGFFRSAARGHWRGSSKRDRLPQAVAQWIEHLFEPGYNEFLLTFTSAAPFIVLAVFSLFHLSGENASKRLAGISGGLVLGTGLLIWGLVTIRMSHSSTAAIGFLFLPFEVAIFMPIGYLAGRLVRRISAP